MPKTKKLKRNQRFNTKHYVLGLIFVGFAIVLLILVIDLAVRYAMPQYRQIHQYDDYLVHTTIPGASKLHINHVDDGAEKIWVRINKQGFRDKEFSVEKESYRIMVYGDSFIEAGFSKLEKTFPKVLENKLGKDVQVINAGVVGYGPDQISLRLEQEIDVYKPDLMIVALYVGNDFSDLMRNKIYSLDEGETGLVLNPYYISPSLKLKRKMGQLFPSLMLYSRGLNNLQNRKIESERTMDMVYWDTLYNKNDCKELLYHQDYEINNVFFDYHDYDVVLDPESYCSQYKLKLMHAILRHIKQTSNSELILLIIPSRHDIDDHYFNKYVNITKYPQYDRAFLTSAVETMAVESSINYINLFQPFTEKNRVTPLYFPRDGHWNDAGQEYAAELVKNFLES